MLVFVYVLFKKVGGREGEGEGMGFGGWGGG